MLPFVLPTAWRGRRAPDDDAALPAALADGISGIAGIEANSGLRFAAAPARNQPIRETRCRSECRRGIQVPRWTGTAVGLGASGLGAPRNNMKRARLRLKNSR